VDFNFLLVLIIVGPWAAMAFYVQTILNQNFNSLVQAVLPSGSATVTAQGQFAGQTIVFVAFAGLCAFFVLMFLNWMSCCCADTEVQYKETLRQAVSAALDAIRPGETLLLLGAHPMDNVSQVFSELAGVEAKTLPRPPRFGIH